MRLTAPALLVVVGALVLAAGRADAYPEFQFSTGATRCSECHLAPMGGGLLADYGRQEAGDTISDGGDGAFLHGLVEPPGWLAIGGDVRLAGFGRQGRGTEAAVFPMQAELSARVAFRGVSVEATAGVLEAIRDANPLAERIGSREHFVMYEPESQGWYVRAGRFHPAYGLRLADHTAYVQRYTGLHSLEESYGLGGGAHGERWDLHATLLTPLEVAPVVGRHGWGLAVEYERLTGESNGAWALSARGLRDDDGLDAWLGVSGKRWFEDSRILLSAQVDAGPQTIDGEGATSTVWRLAGYASAAYRPGSRWSAALTAHLFDPDVRVTGETSSALEARFALFPRAHWELAATLRGELASTDHASGLGLLQLHYYL